MMDRDVLKVVLVDDEPVDLLTLTMYIKRFTDFQLLGAFSSFEDMVVQVPVESVDVLFSDIELSGMNGLEARKRMKDIQVCVFITSHPEYALESFELEVFDFLAKPLSPDRFVHTISRIKEYFTVRYKAELLDHQLGGDVFFIKEGHTQIKINLADIIYLEALKDYTRLITPVRKYTVLSTIGALLKTKEFNSFIRIHRSFAVQKHFISHFDHKEIKVGSTILPIGRMYKDDIQALIV